EAGKILERITRHPSLNQLSRWVLHSLQADLARQRGERWQSEEMEKNLEDDGRVGFPFASYFQATARQAGRTSADAGGRFRLAFESLMRDAPEECDVNIRHFLAGCMRLGQAAWENDSNLWAETRVSLASRLRPLHDHYLHEHYSDVFNGLGASPSRAEAD